MKKLFDERHELPSYVEQWVDEEGTWDHDKQEWIPFVKRHARSNRAAYAVGHYDAATGALVVELKTDLDYSADRRDWMPANRKALELHTTRESALRRIIQIADAWYSEVTSALPVERSDAELLAEYRARQEPNHAPTS